MTFNFCCQRLEEKSKEKTSDYGGIALYAVTLYRHEKEVYIHGIDIVYCPFCGCELKKNWR